jgi:uncharacterized protein YodC (DUF2158 family)
VTTLPASVSGACAMPQACSLRSDAAVMTFRRFDIVVAKAQHDSFFRAYGGFSKMTVLKPGDLVILKSGGPVMTVDTVNTDIFDDDKITGILCAWFVGNKLERARFDPDAIAPAPSPEAAVEKADAPPAEAIGEYKTVLDDMVAAMNDAAEAPDDASRLSVERSKPASTRKYTADVAATASGSAN